MTTDPRPTGPQRFQQPAGAAEHRPVAAALGSAAALLLLVVGVPVALVLLDALPALPTGLPDLATLTATVGTDELLAVLVWVVWLAWLQFAVCVAVEARSAIAGAGLPAHVPLAGPSQRLARTLVVTVLLLVTAAGQATAAAAPAAPVENVTGTAAVSASVVPGPTVTEGSGQAADASAVEVETTYWLGGLQLDQEEGAALEGRRVYVVQPPDGRYHDNLWDISERTVGDGMRYREVFELNRGRVQPDGQELTLERLIYPGWLLVVPDDAAGVDRVTAVETPVPAASTAVDAPDEEVSVDVVPADEAVQSGDAGGDVGAPVAEDVGTRVGAGLAGAGLLAAGLVVALERRRRRGRAADPSDDAAELEVVLRVGADPRRALLLDRALRRLAADLRTAHRPLPGVVVVRVDDAGVELTLSPPVPQAPEPWHVGDGGRTWHLDAARLDPRAVDAPAPFPGLVSLGRDGDGRDVLLDLEAAQGPVAVVGDPTVAREVAAAIVAELATNRWSDALEVVGVGLPAGLDVLPRERYSAAGALVDVLDELRSRRASSTGTDVLTGRAQTDGSQVGVPRYLVLGGVPAAPEAEQLVELSTAPVRRALGVVCAGELPGARWRLEVAASGRLTARLLGVDVLAGRLSDRQVEVLGELLAEDPEPVLPVDELRAAREHEGGTERPDVDPPDRPAAAAQLAQAPVRVHLMGEPRVASPHPLEESRRALCTELVAMLALHPDGLHPQVVAAGLWPGGVTAEVLDRTLERTAAWLGHDGQGGSRLVRDGGGRLRLGPDVAVDWWVVQTLLARSRTAASPEAERADLAQALLLAPAPVAAVRPAGRYAWLARARAEHVSRALLVDAAHRLVVLHHDDDDPAAAQAVAWQGLQVAPTCDLLWRDLLRAADEAGGEAAVRDVVDILEATFASEGVQVEASTRALVDELAPPPVEVDVPGA